MNLRVAAGDAPTSIEDGYVLPTEEELRAEADWLYEAYAKPLEQEHWGEYIAISPKGGSIRGSTSYEVSRQAVEAFGPGNFLFKIGERAIGRLRPRYRGVEG
jgi:hypothetical protein